MWCKYSKIYNYADDTTSSCSGRNLDEIIKNLKHDADAILRYMASNGLVANAKKTVFMVLNMTKAECESDLAKEILVDSVKVQRSSETKLLGVIIDEKQKWKEQLTDLTNQLNKRTYAIRRISNQLPKDEVLKVVQCIWMSKLRYGLQLCNQVRLNPEDTSNILIEAVQVSQNKMLRMLDRVSLKDLVSTVTLLKKYKLPSVNQLAAEIKLVECWKIINIDHYPLKLEPNNPNRPDNDRVIRPSSIKQWKDEAKSVAAKLSFSRDSARIWNTATDAIKNATSLNTAKKEIKLYCNMLPQ